MANSTDVERAVPLLVLRLLAILGRCLCHSLGSTITP